MQKTSGYRFVWILAVCVLTSLSISTANAVSGGAASFSSYSLPATYQQPVYGAHKEKVEDMRVKVMGGFIVMTRSWDRGKWYINGRWQALQTTDCSAEPGTICAILRGGTTYERIAETNVYQHEQNPRETITQTGTGFRWQDRDGNWIVYTDTRLTSYGDRNNVTVTMQYDAEGKRTGVLDHFNNQIIWYEYNAANLVSAIRDYTERRVEYLYDSEGRFTTVTDVRGNTLLYTYAGVNLSTKTDQEGRVTTITYGANGVVASILDQDDAGTTYSYEYDKNKKEFYKQSRSSSGRISESWYDADGELSKTTDNGRETYQLIMDGQNNTLIDSAGNRTTYRYDQWKNLLSTTFPDGATKTTTFDALYSLPLKEKNENGIENTYEYDSNGNLTTKTESYNLLNQRVTTYTYDNFGNRLSRTRASDGVSDATVSRGTFDNYGNMITRRDGQGNIWTYTFNIVGKVLTKTDPLDNVWSNSYDPLGNKLTKVDPQERMVTYTYDGIGNRLTVTDARDNLTRYRYDGRNNLIEVIEPTSVSTAMEYDDDNLLLKRIDQSGKIEIFSYDQEKRLLGRKDANNIIISYSYVDNGNNGAGLIGSIAYPNRLTIYEYDSRGRQVRRTETLPNNDLIVFQKYYDLVGNRTQTIDPLGKVTRYVYDSYDRLIEEIDAINGSTAYSYDNRNNVISVVDPNGSSTTYSYDRNNNKLTEISPLGNVTAFTYDSTNTPISRVDPLGHKIVYIPDGVGLYVAKLYYENTSDQDPSKIAVYTFDSSGNMLTVDDGIISSVSTYDHRNRKTQETVNYGAFSKTYQYVYQNNGRVSTFVGPDGVSVNYGYDRGNLFESLSIPGEGTVTVNSNYWVKPARISFPGGMTKEIQYDYLMRPKSVLVTDPASNVIMSETYTSDANSNIVSKYTEHGEYSYAYDDLNRLITAEIPDYGSERYTYDAVGNRTSSGVSGNVWSYNGGNQLISIGDSSTFSYNTAGNLATKTVSGVSYTYAYNEENRLTEIRQGTNIVGQYYYDPQGRRLWKNLADGQRVYYLYSDQGLIAEFDSSGNEIRQYGYLIDKKWGYSTPLYIKENGGYAYFHNDFIGTPQKITTSNGTLVWSAKYNSFGNITSDVGTINNPLRFPGQYYDEETGMHYNNNRDYDPSLGRYIQTDPLGLPGGINTYSYAEQNPIVNSDPFGLETCGSGWNEPLVPDNPLGFGFSPCCQNHDDCYGECGKSKSSCDNNFLSCMVGSCGSPFFNPFYSTCGGLALLYYGAVAGAGQGAYDDAQGKCDDC
jgi:RHS repeat-associated protein